MANNSIDYKKEYCEKIIDTTLDKGRLITLNIILFYLLLAFFGKHITEFYNFDYIAFAGVLPSALFLALSYTLFRENKKLILAFFGLVYLGLLYTACAYLYASFANTALPDIAKFETIIFLVIVLFLQSVFAYGLRPYLHFVHIVPLAAIILIFAFNTNIGSQDWVLLINLPVIAFFIYLMNRILAKNNFEDFKRSFDIELNESKLILEVERRKRAEEELKQHETQLKKIVEERTTHLREKSTELEKAKEKAEESDRLKTAFMATMSHELRTPLNAIIGFTELMDEDTSKHDFLEFKDIINKSGIRLLTTVEDIFQLTYIETKEIEFYNEKFNLNGFIKSLMDNYEEEKENFHKPYLDLKFNPGLADKDCFIYSDPKRIKTILDKLVNNAIKFTKIGAVEIGYQHHTKGKHENQFVFYVKDTGIGIAKEFHAMIFDRFRQVEETNTRNYEGSGLGTTIAKELSKLLGGDMWLESEPDKGSTFFFNLPIEIQGKKPESKEITVGKKSIPDFSTKRILIAEDTESNFKLLEQYLKKTKVEIIWAVDGVEAVEFCKQDDKIDLILMDMKMPNMNGYEATTEIKKLGVKCPVIAQTAYALQDDEVKTFTAGCDGYLAKPIKSKDLFGIMERYLNN